MAVTVTYKKKEILDPARAVELLERVERDAKTWVFDQTWSGTPAHQLREVIAAMKKLVPPKDIEEQEEEPDLEEEFDLDAELATPEIPYPLLQEIETELFMSANVLAMPTFEIVEYLAKRPGMEKLTHEQIGEAVVYLLEKHLPTKQRPSK